MSNLRSSTSGVVEGFPTDTSPDKIRKAFSDIKAHPSFKDQKLRVSIFSIKNSAKKPFLEENFEAFMDPLETCAFVCCPIKTFSGHFLTMDNDCRCWRRYGVCSGVHQDVL